MSSRTNDVPNGFDSSEAQAKRRSSFIEDSTHTTIVCSKCKLTFPAAAFHLKGVGKSGTPRHHSRCKQCVKADCAHRYRKGKAKAIADRKRRSKSRVLDIAAMSLTEIVSGSEDRPLIDAMHGYIEMMICSRSRR